MKRSETHRISRVKKSAKVFAASVARRPLLASARIIRADVFLSIRQPWAWLIVNGWKDVENRVKNLTDGRAPGWTLIHAGLQRADHFMNICLNVERDFGLRIPVEELQYGGIIGAANFDVAVRKSSSRWFIGPVAYPVLDYVTLPFVKLRGNLGLQPTNPITFSLPA